MIYFNENKEAFGYEIKNPICTIEDELWQQYANTDKWDIIDGEFVDISKTAEYIEKKEQEEKIRISKLKITKRVFALALQQMGVSYADLKTLIATNEQAQLEWDLCVELERSNPLLDVMASQMGVTPEQLDYIFKAANSKET